MALGLDVGTDPRDLRNLFLGELWIDMAKFLWTLGLVAISQKAG